jgi:hypothetical protein
MQCNYSGTQVPDVRIFPELPVECPECHAVTIIPLNKLFNDGFIYPSHKPGKGNPTRKRYKLVAGTWTVVEGRG